MTTSLVIHGHFYQPPRENPWTGNINREPSATPFHNWNERIHAECYRPNAYARVFDQGGKVERIVNNYSNLSFNFGPTLISWIETHYPDTYKRILEADRESVRKHSGHGNAIAQGYNHSILPLCNERDRITQVRWGIADFSYRFRRKPESLWLPETAANDETLATLIDEGMKFVILSPYQAERIRTVGTKEWRDVSDGSIDPGVAYKYFHPNGSGKSIAIFFYDGPISRAIAFEGILASSHSLLDRLSHAGKGIGRLVHVATDGESYGHHFHFGDRCIAHALETEAEARGFRVTNYGEYLENFPPTIEVEIKKGEGTAWSCAHGIGRWYRDCSCHTGGGEGWNQSWRGPLRKALDVLRDRSIEYFEETRGDLFKDPWAARDEYINLILDPAASRDQFLYKHAGRHLHVSERVKALTFLELQRHAMVMYTSCGWFFSEISGIEAVQVLKYAGRVLDFIDDLGLPSPVEKFLEVLSDARSNIGDFGTGADVFRKFVEPYKASPKSLASHIAISSLVTPVEDGTIAGYTHKVTDFQKRSHGRLTMATSRIEMESLSTGMQYDFAHASMHFGGVDFYCVLKNFPGSRKFKESADKLWSNFLTASLPRMFGIAQEEFGPEEFGLEHVLPEGREKISQIVVGALVKHFADEYEFLYEENRRVVEMLFQAGFELPSELKVAAEFTLGRRFEKEIENQHKSLDPSTYQKAIDLAREAGRYGCRLNTRRSAQIVEELIMRAVEALTLNPTAANVETARGLVALSRDLGIEVNLDRPQELIYELLQGSTYVGEELEHLAQLLGLSTARLPFVKVATKPSQLMPQV
jgi:alpha-amylase/alpha-mannosidase (GH57 family)